MYFRYSYRLFAVRYSFLLQFNSLCVVFKASQLDWFAQVFILNIYLFLNVIYIHIREQGDTSRRIHF